jgi:MerR family transcriptional regulator, copper efflux regulator
MKISELAAKTGVTVATIRFYEKVGLLATRSLHRRENNYRDYNEEAIQRLIDLKEVQATAGFTITELKELVTTYDAGELTTQKEIAFLQQKVDAVGKKIAELERVQTYLRSQLISLLQKEPFATDQDKSTPSENPNMH